MSAASFKEQGNKFLQAKQFDEAIAAYTEAINLDPKDHVFFSNRSAAYLSKGDSSSALADGERCTELKADWPKGYTRKGAALHALRRYSDAVAAYEAGLAVAPADAGLASGLAEVKKAQEAAAQAPRGGGGGGAGGLFGPQMIAKLAGHPKFGPKLADPTFMTKLQMAQANPQMMMQDPEMMEVLTAILGGAGGDGADGGAGAGTAFTPPAAPTPAPVPAEPLTEEEQAAQDAKDRAAEVRARSVEAKTRGNTLYKEKRFTEALAAYDEAVEIDGTNLMVLNNKAAVYIEMGETGQAIEVCGSLFERARADAVKMTYEEKAKVHQRIAAAHLKAGDLSAALKSYGDAQMESFDKAVERKIKTLELEKKKQVRQQYINPELGLEAKERGNAAFREGNFPQAIAEYEDCVKRDPTNAPYHNNLAAAYLKMGVFNDAKKMVEKSLELDKTYVKAWAKKGDIEFFMKEYHKSMDSYKAGLALEPDNSLCRQGLQKTMQKVNEGGDDKERAAHGMADPEIQAILQDPSIRQVLTDFQENPRFAQQAMQNDAGIRAKIEKLIAAGVLQVK